MRSFSYAAEFEPGDKRGIVVSFPDVPEAITRATIWRTPRAGRRGVGLALLTYPEGGLPLPKARARPRLHVGRGSSRRRRKLAVLEAFTAAGIGKSGLGRRMGKDEKEVRRIPPSKAPDKAADAGRSAVRARKTPRLSVEEAA